MNWSNHLKGREAVVEWQTFSLYVEKSVHDRTREKLQSRLLAGERTVFQFISESQTEVIVSKQLKGGNWQCTRAQLKHC
jgi:hypothetical protein